MAVCRTKDALSINPTQNRHIILIGLLVLRLQKENIRKKSSKISHIPTFAAIFTLNYIDQENSSNELKA